jgi:hypothetical protein
LFFPLAGGVSLKLRETGGSSVALVAFLKDKTGGSQPAGSAFVLVAVTHKHKAGKT